MLVGSTSGGVLAATPVQGEPRTPVFSELRPILVWGVIGAITLIVLLRRGAIVPKSLNATRQRSLEGTTWLFWLGAAFAVYFLMIVGSALGFAVTDALNLAPDGLASNAAITWSAYVVAIAGAAGLLIARRRELSRAGFRAEAHDAWMGIGAYLLVFPIVTAVLLAAAAMADAFRGEPSDPISHDLLAQLANSERGIAWWAMVGAVVVAAPIVEEVIYRGCLQSCIRRAGGTTTSAILLTALIFAAAHASTVRAEALLGLFVLGIGFGVVFERTGRLGTAIVMHAAFNGANIAQAILFK